MIIKKIILYLKMQTLLYVIILTSVYNNSLINYQKEISFRLFFLSFFLQNVKIDLHCNINIII